MKAAFQTWLELRGRLPGVLGCGIRFPDHTSLGRANITATAADKMDQAWHQVAEVMTGLAQHRLAATRSLWTFAEGQVHCALRPDGIVLALIPPASTHAYSPAVIETLIREFMDLGPEGPCPNPQRTPGSAAAAGVLGPETDLNLDP
jgi:hypothetical protein